MRLHDFLQYQQRERGEQEYARLDTGESLTYQQAAGKAHQLANALHQSGLAKGDRFAFLAKNCLEYSYVYFAASRLGAVPVPMNFRLAAQELAYIIEDSGSTAVIAQTEFVPALESVRGQLGKVQRFVAIGGTDAEGWIDYEAFISKQDANDSPVLSDPDCDLYQMYTSGTTGHPKGVMLRQRAVLEQMMQLLPALDCRPGDRVLTVAPMYHAAAAVSCMANVMAGGSTVIHRNFDPADVVRTLAEEKIARVTLVPAMIQACVDMVPDVASHDYANLRTIAYGASPIAPSVLERANQVFGCDFTQGYGLTETTAAATFLSPRDHRLALAGQTHLLRSAGRPVAGTELRIVDPETGAELPIGQPGEILVRGGQLMHGYWGLPEASEKALRDGWLWTGDAGKLDEHGYLYIEDRIKDMIVSGGENIYPREVELALLKHPAVADVAVVGIPDDKLGEAVLAFIVSKPGSDVVAEELDQHCLSLIARYKRPRHYEAIAELPRNPSGKVLKRVLREKFWEGRERGVA